MTAPRWTSHACTRSAEPQSDQVLAIGAPRHPYPGPRPEASGYCTEHTACSCACHSNHEGE
jgi:hypothetical protein